MRQSPLGVGAAIDRILALRGECQSRIEKAAQKIRADFDQRESAIFERVPEDQRGRLAAMLEAAEPVAAEAHDDEDPMLACETVEVRNG